MRNIFQRKNFPLRRVMNVECRDVTLHSPCTHQWRVMSKGKGPTDYVPKLKSTISAVNSMMRLSLWSLPNEMFKWNKAMVDLEFVGHSGDDGVHFNASGSQGVADQIAKVIVSTPDP